MYNCTFPLFANPRIFRITNKHYHVNKDMNAIAIFLRWTYTEILWNELNIWQICPDKGIYTIAYVHAEISTTWAIPCNVALVKTFKLSPFLIAAA